MPLSCKDVHATIGDYQRNYLYKMFIEDVPEVIRQAYPEALTFQMNVDLYNKKAIFPKREAAKIKISWAGEFFNIPGVDNSVKEGDFLFYEDEPMRVYDFFNALKDLTGNEENNATVYSTLAKFNIGIAQVSVDKETIRNYRRLIGVRVYAVDIGDTDKTGDNVHEMTVNMSWDRAKTVTEMRGSSKVQLLHGRKDLQVQGSV